MNLRVYVQTDIDPAKIRMANLKQRPYPLTARFRRHGLANLVKIVKIQYAHSQNLNNDPTREEISLRVRLLRNTKFGFGSFLSTCGFWAFAQTESRPDNTAWLPSTARSVWDAIWGIIRHAYYPHPNNRYFTLHVGRMKRREAARIWQI